jgi:hypothetical protein
VNNLTSILCSVNCYEHVEPLTDPSSSLVYQLFYMVAADVVAHLAEINYMCLIRLLQAVHAFTYNQFGHSV